MTLLIVLAVITLLARVGIALYAAGLVRAKNSAAMVFRILMDLCITVLAFWLIGGAILLQKDGDWFGINMHFVGWYVGHARNPNPAQMSPQQPMPVPATQPTESAAPQAGSAPLSAASQSASVLAPATSQPSPTAPAEISAPSPATPSSLGDELEHSSKSFFLFLYLTLILTATAVVAGAVAERCRLLPVCISSLVLAALVFPVTSNWVWFGWLKHRGFVDLGGASCLHVTAGVFAFVAAMQVGPRFGKYNRDRSSTVIPGHNLPMAAIGALLIAVGWIAAVTQASVAGRFGMFELATPDTQSFIAFVAGLVAMNVVLAAAAATLTSVVVAQWRYGKPDLILALSGLLGGLVSVSAGGFFFLQSWEAVVIGAIGGLLVSLAVVMLDLRLRVDDPLGMIAIHGIGGAWGTLAVGFFINTPVTYSHTRLSQIGVQATGLIVIALFAAFCSMILFGVLKATIGLRLKESYEFEGLDLVEHDISAYPDFQQNTIKSHHTREA